MKVSAALIAEYLTFKDLYTPDTLTTYSFSNILKEPSRMGGCGEEGTTCLLNDGMCQF